MAKKSIVLGNRLIGDNQPPFMIAEIGINHNGDMQIAKKLIDAAFACDWHCVKFQKRTPELCVPNAQKNVIRETPWGKITYLKYRHKVEFGFAEYSFIDKYCREKPINWTSSAWDLPSLEFLMEFDVPFIKIPSAKLTDFELLKATAESGKPVVLSTGMSSIEEIDMAVENLEKHSNGDYILMHTNSAYPAPIEEVNLHVIEFLRDRYDCIVGYSGHEYNLEPTMIASYLGAKIIERHVTLSHDMWGSDQAASLEVHAMDLLYKRIKSINIMLGDGVKRITPKEMESRKKLRGEAQLTVTEA
ncbi:MAG: N-acetylneuraminate synthase family protein [Planctomycetota bacterium]|jgi:N-acetylneuraminate synthase